MRAALKHGVSASVTGSTDSEKTITSLVQNLASSVWTLCQQVRQTPRVQVRPVELQESELPQQLIQLDADAPKRNTCHRPEGAMRIESG